MKEGVYELRISSDFEGLEKAASFVEETLKMHEVDAVISYKVRLAIDEAATNVVRHGYKGVKGDIWITLKIYAGSIVAVVRDKGVPFDPASYPPPDVEAGLDEREVGGLGIFMIKKMMDKLEYSRKDGMNITTMSVSL